MSKTIADLREHLFAAIAGVRNGTVTIEQAKTISELSQVIVNSAKVEVDFVRATQRNDSHFLAGHVTQIEGTTAATVTPPAAGQATVGNGILGITRHILQD